MSYTTTSRSLCAPANSLHIEESTPARLRSSGSGPRSIIRPFSMTIISSKSGRRLNLWVVATTTCREKCRKTAS